MFCGLAAAEKLSPPRTEKYFVEGARYSACKIDPRIASSENRHGADPVRRLWRSDDGWEPSGFPRADPGRPFQGHTRRSRKSGWRWPDRRAVRCKRHIGPRGEP
jgi:hypothetical protein